jgi:3-phosphoshikimate 1-carboxyvinyltransferase
MQFVHLCRHFQKSLPSMQDSYTSLPLTTISPLIDQLPGDKSISHRAILLGSLTTGVSEFRGFLNSEDCLATLKAMRLLGVPIEHKADAVQIKGVGFEGLKAPRDFIDCGNAGTLCRLLVGILVHVAGKTTLMGDDSLSRRPMQRILTPLAQMGAHISSNQGRLPLTISGSRLRGIEYALPIPSAQLKSCLLLAGVGAQGETHLISPGICRDHTERLLQSMQCDLLISGSSIRVSGVQTLAPVKLEIPSDFSSAAFWMILAAGLKQPLQLNGIGVNPTRIGLLKLLEKMGVSIVLLNQRQYGLEPVADILITPGRALCAITVGAEEVAHSIDEIPIFCILAAIAQGTTRITGAAELAVKESNRLEAMANGLQRLGIACQVLTDGLEITGGSIQGGEVDSVGDHRIAMAFLIAGCLAKNPVKVHGCLPIMTSYPSFISDAERLGLALIEGSKNESK